MSRTITTTDPITFDGYQYDLDALMLRIDETVYRKRVVLVQTDSEDDDVTHLMRSSYVNITERCQLRTGVLYGAAGTLYIPAGSGVFVDTAPVSFRGESYPAELQINGGHITIATPHNGDSHGYERLSWRRFALSIVRSLD